MAKKKKKFDSSTLKFILAILLVGYFSVTFIQQQVKINSLKANAQTIQTEIKAEKERTNQIKNEKKKNNYLSKIESIARDNLGYLKKDEILFIDSSLK